MGAVPFLRYGEESRTRLAKLDAKLKEHKEGEGPQEGGIADGEKAILEIENSCTEWRAGSVIPQWIYLVEQRLPNGMSSSLASSALCSLTLPLSDLAFGCALKITLSPHIQRTYSILVSVDYPKKSLAKAACAKLAIEDGVIDFIKHGDGLEQPVQALPGGGVIGGNEGVLRQCFFVLFGHRFGLRLTGMIATTTGPVTLQAFHAALPKPMPDEIGTKHNGEVNAVAWLNNMVQVCPQCHWFCCLCLSFFTTSVRKRLANDRLLPLAY